MSTGTDSPVSSRVIPYSAALAERDRLKAINAELVEALEQLAVLGEEGMKPDPAEWITFHDKVSQIARAALDKARKEG